MPICDGHTAQKKISTSLLTGNPPVVALTANTDSDTQLRCKESGFFAYLSKVSARLCAPIMPRTKLTKLFSTLRFCIKPLVRSRSLIQLIIQLLTPWFSSPEYSCFGRDSGPNQKSYLDIPLPHPSTQLSIQFSSSIFFFFFSNSFFQALLIHIHLYSVLSESNYLSVFLNDLGSLSESRCWNELRQD